MARRIVHPPEARRLGGGQPQAWHFDELAPDAVDEGVGLHGVLSSAGEVASRTPAASWSKRHATQAPGSTVARGRATFGTELLMALAIFARFLEMAGEAQMRRRCRFSDTDVTRRGDSY